jgi:hypothetical protein
MGKDEEVRRVQGKCAQWHTCERAFVNEGCGGGAHHLRALVRERGYTYIYERSFANEVDSGSQPFTNERSRMRWVCKNEHNLINIYNIREGVEGREFEATRCR